MTLVNLVLLAVAFVFPVFSAVLPDHRRSAVQRSQTECSSGLCFESFTDTSEDTTVGFILPALTPGGSPTSNEFIIKTSFSLPYGFAGTTLGSLVKESGGSLTGRTIGNGIIIADYIGQQVALKRSSLSQMVAQPSILQPDNTLTPFGNGVTTTLSPLSTLTEDRADLIFLVKGFPPAEGTPEVLVSREPITLTMILSDTQPVFLGSSGSAATLPLAGSEQVEFVLDAPAARSENFDEVLRIAGFD